MTNEISPTSELDILLSKTTITEEDILQFPDFPFEETPITQIEEIISGIASTPQQTTPKNNPRNFILNGRVRKRKNTCTLQQTLAKQKRNEEAANTYDRTRNPRFQFNLTYSLKEDVNLWRIIFWDQKRQEFTLENPSLNNQRIAVPLRSISAFCE